MHHFAKEFILSHRANKETQVTSTQRGFSFHRRFCNQDRLAAPRWHLFPLECCWGFWGVE